MITVPLVPSPKPAALARAQRYRWVRLPRRDDDRDGFVGYVWAIATGAPRAIKRDADVTSLLNTFPPAGRMSGPVAGAVCRQPVVRASRAHDQPTGGRLILNETCIIT
jgi:hypothetical protein